MNCYNEIKNELINNEVYKKVKDYSKNRNDLITYYNVGKMLSESGKHYNMYLNHFYLLNNFLSFCLFHYWLVPVLFRYNNS